MRHSYMIITTDFELEPVLEQYFATYPAGEYTDHTIVFKAEGEHYPGDRSYIVVFTLNPVKPRADRVTFRQFLDSYCTVNNLVACAGALNSALPQMDVHLRNGRYLGNTDKLKDRKQGNLG
jgi:hypothetical protein